MYENFRFLINAAELIGKIEKMTMYEAYASIDLIDIDGKKVSITMSIAEDLNNDVV